MADPNASGPSFQCPCCGKTIHVAEDTSGQQGQSDDKKAGVKKVAQVLSYADMMKKGV